MTKEEINQVTDIIHKTIYSFFDICGDDEETPITKKDKTLLEVNKIICNKIKSLETERKTGRWAYTDRTNVYGGREIVCSACGESFMISPKTQEQLYECERFCCRCGARMEVEHE